MPSYYIYDKKSLKAVQKNSFDKDTIYLIYSKHCGPCHMFLPLWTAFTKKHNKDSVAVEVSFVNSITNPLIKKNLENMMEAKPYVPNVAKHSMKTNRTYLFNKDRTMKNLLKFFPKMI